MWIIGADLAERGEGAWGRTSPNCCQHFDICFDNVKMLHPEYAVEHVGNSTPLPLHALLKIPGSAYGMHVVLTFDSFLAFLDSIVVQWE